MAQLALQAGLPAEALRIVEQGYRAGVLGAGAEAARHQRLRDLATKQAGDAKAAIAGQAAEAAGDKEGDRLVQVGFAHVSMGEFDRGLQLIHLHSFRQSSSPPLWFLYAPLPTTRHS